MSQYGQIGINIHFLNSGNANLWTSIYPLENALISLIGSQALLYIIFLFEAGVVSYQLLGLRNCLDFRGLHVCHEARLNVAKTLINARQSPGKHGGTWWYSYA